MQDSVQVKFPRRRMPGKELLRKYRFYDKRIGKLWSAKQRVEALSFMSMIVELLVREAIIEFEKLIEAAAVQHHIYFNPRNLYSRDDIEEQSLGFLIKILNTYTNDKNLIGNLHRFNAMRVKCIHQLLKHEISQVNKELSGFDSFYYQLVLSLMELNASQLEIAHNHFVPVCHDCFVKSVPEQIKL